ncbi:MAG: hypothetical protein ACPGWM_04040, partial [Flavobacteriales bacterium]
AYNGYNPYMQSSFLKFRESNEFSGIVKLPLIWEKNELFEDLKNKGNIELFEWDSQNISCDIQVDSVPFEVVFTQNQHENWEAYLNGELVPSHSEFDALMGIDIDTPGKYTLELKFSNSQYKKGIMFTVVGWLIFGSLAIFSRKKIRSYEQS